MKINLLDVLDFFVCDVDYRTNAVLVNAIRADENACDFLADADMYYSVLIQTNFAVVAYAGEAYDVRFSPTVRSRLFSLVQ